MNKIYKAILSAAAVSIVAGTMITPASVNAAGDSANGRKSYTIAEIDAGNLGDNITFNSIIDGKIGDEKNFVGAKLSTSTADVWNADTVNVKDGEVYTIRIYVHNNSPKGTEKIAEGVKASFSLPTTVAKEQTIIGYIDSSNATPNRYWDEVTLKSDSDIYLEYINGSAKFTNAKLGTVALPDEVTTAGATIGYDALNGKIPGCFEYDGVVTIQVKVHKSVSTSLQKYVRIKGTKTWAESVNAKIGDEVEYKIEYKNLLAEDVHDVMIKDSIPADLEYVNGSTRFYNESNMNGTVVKDTITTTGLNIGDYSANGNAKIIFTAKVVNKDLACGNNQIINWASTAINGNGVVVAKDDASVMVVRDDAACKDVPTPPTPHVIVDTGAGTIVTGAIGAGAMVTTLGYYIASRKKLMK